MERRLLDLSGESKIGASRPSRKTIVFFGQFSGRSGWTNARWDSLKKLIPKSYNAIVLIMSSHSEMDLTKRQTDRTFYLSRFVV
jgi:hypothetical protein